MSPLMPNPVLLRGLLPPGRAASVGAQIDDALAGVSAVSGLPAAEIERLTSAWHGRTPFVAAAVKDILPEVRRALTTSPLCDDVLAEPISATLFVSSAAHGVGTHAHQDLAYRWHRDAVPYAYTTWVALDPADISNGGLLFRAGEANETLSTRQDFLDADFADAASSGQWQAHQNAPSVARGDAVCFSALHWHAASACRPGGRRRAIALRWPSRSGWEHRVEVNPPKLRPDRFGMDTSGRLFCQVARSALQAFGSSADAADPTACANALVGHERVMLAVGVQAAGALRDLQTALRLRVGHGGRPARGVWEGIRDHAIPALHELAHVGGAA